MKVIAAELVSRNVFIEFETLENVKQDDYFKVNVSEKNYEFQACDIKVVGEKLKVKAKEVGYWATKLDHKGVDLRTVIGCEIVAVTDDAEKKKIYEKSCWC